MYQAPAFDEIEVSIFGPGYGEAIVVHLGYGDWATVDSCLSPTTKAPVTLDYLLGMGLDPSKVIRIVVASQYDDDHIKGLGRLFAEAKSASFATSGIVTSGEFNEVLAAWGYNHFLPGGSGLEEMKAVFSELKRRQADTRYPHPKRASHNKVLWDRFNPTAAEVRALSPSDQSVQVAISKLVELGNPAASNGKKLPKQTDNHSSIVLAVRVDNTSFLLGADLQIKDDPSFGWKAVVNSHNAGQVHELFKLSHHASENGDTDGIWQQMLQPDPIAITSPFIKGDVFLPTKTDCERVLGRTSQAYLTAVPFPGKFRDQNNSMQRLIREHAKTVHLVPGSFGHVRARKKIFSENPGWDIKLFGGARSFQDTLKLF